MCFPSSLHSFYKHAKNKLAHINKLNVSVGPTYLLLYIFSPIHEWALLDMISSLLKGVNLGFRAAKYMSPRSLASRSLIKSIAY